MENNKVRAGRTWVWAVAAVGAVFTAVAPAGFAAASTVQDGAIVCNSVQPDGDTVVGQSCDTNQWGPLSNFVIADRGGASYACESGWAEGSLWVSGQNCRKL